MNARFVIVSLMYVFLSGGCWNHEKNDQKKPNVMNFEKDSPSLTNRVVRIGETHDVLDQEMDVLAQLDVISRLWPTNFMQAYHEIERLRNCNPTSFFCNANACQRYVDFFKDLQFENIPLEKRGRYIDSVFMRLGHMLSASTEIVPDNRVFLCMFYADYIDKLRDEHRMICSLLESAPSLPEIPPLRQFKDEDGRPFRMLPKSKKEQWDLYSKRKHRMEVMTKYKRRILYLLDRHLDQGLDTKSVGEKISLIPEPRRTEVINYIESKIGRRMKWRE